MCVRCEYIVNENLAQTDLRLCIFNLFFFLYTHSLVFVAIVVVASLFHSMCVCVYVSYFHS